MKGQRFKPSFLSLSIINANGLACRTMVLDENFTIIKGGNGAGKTSTLMLKWLAMMPDLTYVRLEGGTSDDDKKVDKGLLGRVNTPCIVALKVSTLTGEQALYFVRLEKTKNDSAKPAMGRISLPADCLEMEPTDFLIEKTSERTCRPRSLDEIRNHAGSLGAIFTRFDSAGDYCESLHKDGLLPKPFKHPSQRKQFANIIRSSLNGGLEVSITRNLGEYLLSQQSNLGEQVQTLQDTLRKIRQFRHQLEAQEIAQRLFETMLQNGEYITVNAWAELEVDAREKQHQFNALIKEIEDLQNQSQTLAKEIKKLIEEISEATGEKQELIKDLKKLRDAHQQAGQLKILHDDLNSAMKKRQAAQTELDKFDPEQRQADKEKGTLERHCKQLKDDQKILTMQVTDQQVLFEEESRKRGLYSIAKNCKELAEKALKQEIDVNQIAPLIEELQQGRKTAFDRSNELERQVIKFQDIQETHQFAKLVLAQLEEHEPRAFALAAQGERLLYWDGQQEKLVRLAATLEGLQKQDHSVRTALQTREKLLRALNPLTPRWALKTHDAYQQSLIALRVQHNNRRNGQRDQLLAQQEILGQQNQAKEALIQTQRDHQHWSDAQNLLRGPIQEFIFMPLTKDSFEQAGRKIRSCTTEVNTRYQTCDGQLDGIVREIQVLSDQGQARQTRNLRELAKSLEGLALIDVYDHIGLHEAGEVEAALGPLSEAILVRDLDQAAKDVAELDLSQLDDLYLIEYPALSTDEACSILVDELIEDITARFDEAEEPEWLYIRQGEDKLRISRVREKPLLGAQARRKRIEELEKEKATLELQLDELAQRQSKLEVAEDALRKLLPHNALLLAGEPDIPSTKAALADINQRWEKIKSDLERLQGEIAQDEDDLAILQEFTSQSELLDANPKQELEQLQPQIESAEQAQILMHKLTPALEQLNDKRALLSETYPEDIETLQRQCEAERKRGEDIGWQLNEVWTFNSCKEDLRYADSVQRVGEQQKALGEIQEKLKQVGEELELSEDQLKLAQERFNELDKENSIRKSLVKDANNVIEDKQTKIKDYPFEYREGMLTEFKLKISQQEQAERDAGKREELARSQKSTKEKDHHQVKEQLKQSSKEQPERKAELKEAQRELKQLTDDLVDKGCHNLLHGAMTAALDKSSEERCKVLNRSYNTLIEVSMNQVGADDPFRRWLLEDAHDAALSEKGTCYAKAVGLVTRQVNRQWVRSDDPRQMLQELDKACQRTRETLQRDEEAFQAEGMEIATLIKKQIRAEKKGVSRLNTLLQTVAFGQIRTLRLNLAERKDFLNVLDALQNQHQFMDLFQDEQLDIEEALAMLYTRVAGGKIQGEKLLDHREYLRVSIEFQRSASSKFEQLSANNTSTGERIGCGLAVMVSIMKNWARQSQVRGAFDLAISVPLDEATRLDPSSLKVVYELTRRAGIHVLTAAPVVSFEGGTSYQYVRNQTTNELRIHGVKTLAENETMIDQKFFDQLVHAPRSLSTLPQRADT